MTGTGPYPPHPRIGGTDGERGPATLEPGAGRINPESFAGYTHALVGIQIEDGAGNLVVVGRDTRPSGLVLEEAVIAGAVAAGGAVRRLGIAPTPAILKTAQVLGAGSAVAVTASHNKATDNGWKGTLGEHKPVGDQIDAISNRYWAETDSGLAIPLNGDSVQESPELLTAYMAMVVENIEQEFGERPLEGKIFVVDGANGAAMKVTPQVLRALGATVEEFACDDDGVINHKSGAADLSGVKQFLRSRPDLVRNPNFVGAVANDGDVDRMIGVGASIGSDGIMRFHEMDGNRIMELQAEGQPGIIGTHYTNDAMVSRLRERGIGFEFCENGDSNVTAALRQKQAAGENWTRGGEFTGHNVDLTWLSSGDGVRMAAWLAAYAARAGTSFYALAESMPLWPETMIKVELPAGVVAKEVMEQARVVAAIEEAAIALHGIGRQHTRASGTEPVIRVWGVGQDAKIVNTVITGLAAVIKS